MSRPFLLLEPGPLVPDEPHQRGDADLFAANNMGNIAAHVLGGRLPVVDYTSRIVCLSDWRRKGGEYDLAPLGHRFPDTARPDFRPLPKAALEAAFTLAPGGCRLSEADKGEPMPTQLGGFGAPASGGTTAPAAGASGGIARAASGAVPTKIKLKVTAGGGGGTKRRRDGSEGPAG